MFGGYSKDISKTYEIFDEGYRRNAIVYSCVMEIIKAVGCLQIDIYNKDKLVDNPDIEGKLSLSRGGLYRTGLLETMAAYYCLYGETFIHRRQAGTMVNGFDLWLPPSVVTNYTGNGTRYQYGDKSYFVPVIEQRPEVGHLIGFAPFGRGISPLDPIATDVDIRNEGKKWNFSLLKCGAKFDVVMRPKNDFIDQDSLNKIMAQIRTSLQGGGNAGGVKMFSAPLEVTTINQTARDMDFQQSMTESAYDICRVFGVPLPIVFNDASTYNNYREAKEQFYINTVLPLAYRLLAFLNDWWLSKFHVGYELRINEERIPALENKRARMFTRLKEAVAGSILTPNEARLEMGYEPIKTENADQLLVSRNTIPLDMAGDPSFDMSGGGGD